MEAYCLKWSIIYLQGSQKCTASNEHKKYLLLVVNIRWNLLKYSHWSWSKIKNSQENFVWLYFDSNRTPEKASPCLQINTYSKVLVFFYWNFKAFNMTLCSLTWNPCHAPFLHMKNAVSLFNKKHSKRTRNNRASINGLNILWKSMRFPHFIVNPVKELKFLFTLT